MNCRICFEGDEEHPLRQPCKCTGSIGQIHEHCLLTWLETKRMQVPACELCKSPYQFIYNRPLEAVDEISLIRAYFLVYPCWHTLAVCILQIILSKLMHGDPKISYLHAQIVYQTCYASISLGSLAASLHSPLIYIQYLFDTGVSFTVFIHIHLWTFIFVFHESPSAAFIVLSILNQCYLGIYPILHSRAIQQMNKDRDQILV